ncbi:MAG: hypothetical protein FJX75_01520 [Armatimonadetes bacterium]|nr:hypothetical protein [Armatimonadota bacterium]
MQLSLAARYYLAMVWCLVLAVAGVWLCSAFFTTTAPSLGASVALVVGLTLTVVAVFGMVESTHLCVVAVASTIDDCARQAGALLTRAHRQVLIVAGEGSAQFWDRPEVAEPLRAAVSRGVSVEVIIGARAMATSEMLVNLVGTGRIQLAEVPYVPSPHFMVVDSSGFRIESPHARQAETREGFAWQHGPMGARILEEHFAALRAEAVQWGPGR